MPSVFEPASVREAAEAFAAASREGQRVSIERDAGDLVLSTRSLDRLLEHAAGDLTATVEAGIRLSVLNRALAEDGQMLALDPPGDPTVGACIAGNLSGPRRHRYGTARDLVLGVTVVLADGTVASSGGKVVKNVAGYDLGKLFCGSRGTLGLVARASLRLHPLSEAARTLAVPVNSPEAAERLARSLHRSHLVPSAVDLHWPGRLVVLFEGRERAVAAQLESAQALLGGAEAGAEVWSEGAARQAAARGKLRVPRGALARALPELPEAVVRVAHGVAYVAEPVAEQLPEAAGRLNERVRSSFDPTRVLV